MTSGSVYGKYKRTLHLFLHLLRRGHLHEVQHPRQHDARSIHQLQASLCKLFIVGYHAALLVEIMEDGGQVHGIMRQMTELFLVE